jgi:hypothetical protein
MTPSFQWSGYARVELPAQRRAVRTHEAQSSWSPIAGLGSRASRSCVCIGNVEQQRVSADASGAAVHTAGTHGKEKREAARSARAGRTTPWPVRRYQHVTHPVVAKGPRGPPGLIRHRAGGRPPARSLFGLFWVREARRTADAASGREHRRGEQVGQRLTGATPGSAKRPDRHGTQPHYARANAASALSSEMLLHATVGASDISLRARASNST